MRTLGRGNMIGLRDGGKLLFNCINEEKGEGYEEGGEEVSFLSFVESSRA
jgi:hypothetical protein